MVDIILASGSPRRSDILKQVGIDFTVKTSKVKEDFADNLTPEQVVMELAARKCEAVFSEVLPEKDTVVISADAIVVYEDEILGKPKDENDAYNTLKRLSGHIHQVYTGVTMTYFINGKFRIDTFADCANVYFRELTDKEIKEYVKTGEPMDKAGSYGIQGIGALLIDKIDGDYYTIVGLPISKVYRALKINIENMSK